MELYDMIIMVIWKGKLLLVSRMRTFYVQFGSRFVYFPSLGLVDMSADIDL
jgi:hypothetical protein